jgi:hypothetical protein
MRRSPQLRRRPDEPEVIASLLPPKDAPRPSAVVRRPSERRVDGAADSRRRALLVPSVTTNDYVDRVLLVQQRRRRPRHRRLVRDEAHRAREPEQEGTTVILESVNQRYEPIVIESRSDDELRPIAALGRVLWSPTRTVASSGAQVEHAHAHLHRRGARPSADVRDG